MKRISAILLALALPLIAAVPGSSPWSYPGGLTATLVGAKGAPCLLTGYNASNVNSSTVYLQIFDAASTSGITLGSTTPDVVLGIPANGVLDGPQQIAFQHGIVIAATTTATGSSAPSSAVPVTLFTN